MIAQADVRPSTSRPTFATNCGSRFFLLSARPLEN